MNFIINTDGASRGNPGPGAAAYVIKGEDGVIWVQEGHYIGTTTNNVAEYSAVKLAFEKLISNFAKHLPASVELITDSNLMANQLAGKFKINNPGLKTLHDQIKSLEKQIGSVHYRYAPRAENFIADKLANIALDNQADNS